MMVSQRSNLVGFARARYDAASRTHEVDAIIGDASRPNHRRCTNNPIECSAMSWLEHADRQVPRQERGTSAYVGVSGVDR